MERRKSYRLYQGVSRLAWAEDNYLVAHDPLGADLASIRDKRTYVGLSLESCMQYPKHEDE